MMKLESNRMEVAERAYTEAIKRIDNDHLDDYYRLARLYEQLCNGNFSGFRKFMALCKAV